jgi:hypothetical protein
MWPVALVLSASIVPIPLGLGNSEHRGRLGLAIGVPIRPEGWVVLTTGPFFPGGAPPAFGSTFGISLGTSFGTALGSTFTAFAWGGVSSPRLAFAQGLGLGCDLAWCPIGVLSFPGVLRGCRPGSCVGLRGVSTYPSLLHALERRGCTHFTGIDVARLGSLRLSFFQGLSNRKDSEVAELGKNIGDVDPRVPLLVNGIPEVLTHLAKLLGETYVQRLHCILQDVLDGTRELVCFVARDVDKRGFHRL